MNYVKNLVLKGIPLQPMEDESKDKASSSIYENWLQVQYVFKLIQKDASSKINPAQVDVYSVLLLIYHTHAVARNDF